MRRRSERLRVRFPRDVMVLGVQRDTGDGTAWISRRGDGGSAEKQRRQAVHLLALASGATLQSGRCGCTAQVAAAGLWCNGWLHGSQGCSAREGGHGWRWAEFGLDGLLRLGWLQIEQMVDDEQCHS
ncbi:hypothetical protein E2562_021265 [Oryza meyeriana var. granulata]|uniref:Uncharacterized protein n=1 Tax=Oryza meyeriana var. granulata TaxID=110450 RepID=A0A6G1DZK4_9ORYZ|nr:hypothetical protein E2562_021265 [Oryza meyeriana var. granulata]